jgi:hypothetical protein
MIDLNNVVMLWGYIQMVAVILFPGCFLLSYWWDEMFDVVEGLWTVYVCSLGAAAIVTGIALLERVLS